MNFQHKLQHKTNPENKPNPFNNEPTIRLIDFEGNYVSNISQITSYYLIKYSKAILVPNNKATLKLCIPTEEYLKINWNSQKIKSGKYLKSSETVIYGNYNVYSPDEQLMFTTNAYKILWYLNRSLAEWIGEYSVKLKFNPDGPGHINDAYYLSKKENRCVVCGSGKRLNKHHVVPNMYRKNMHIAIKSHSYHDILPVCIECHENYESKANDLKQQIAEEYDFPVNAWMDKEGKKYFAGTVDRKEKDFHYVLRIAVALEEHWEKIPEERRKKLIQIITNFYGQEPTKEQISDLAKFRKDFKLRKPSDVIDHGEYISTQMKTVEDIQRFAERWRQHFVDSMQPKFLPENWSLTKEVARER